MINGLVNSRHLSNRVYFDGIQGAPASFHTIPRPDKEPAEFNFTSGLNILWGSSDTGKTFLVEAIDFMLGGGEELRDIPERDGYDHILLD